MLELLHLQKLFPRLCLLKNRWLKIDLKGCREIQFAIKWSTIKNEKGEISFITLELFFMLVWLHKALMMACRSCCMCIAFRICCKACCFAVLLSSDITIVLNVGAFLFDVLICGFSLSYNPKIDDPSGSLATGNITGSTFETVCVSWSVQAMEWELPQATRFMWTSSSPWTKAGFRLTRVVPLPCWPWSLSPQA